MGEKMLVKESLSPAMIEAGKELTRALDKEENVSASFWLFASDVGDWRLVLGMPSLNRVGPRAAYMRIQKILSRLKKRPHRPLPKEFNLEKIVVLESTNLLLNALKMLITTGRAAVEDIRLTNNNINGITIEDAYVYRLS